ncbi:MAG: HipA domain-containing protein [Clostridia bacterium]|nr:HipA domain-containing protein [Clostridia bacterium]
MTNRNYEILSENTVVAIWQNNKLNVLNEALLPLYLRKIQNADMWLETRAIDSHRANSRLLKKALRLTDKDDISTVIHVNGATIIDNYWIREIGSNLTYDDVKFEDDYFSNLALKGNYDSFNRAANSKRSKTPELTNVGSFEKCWKLRDGKWWMYKKASHEEMFSELFIYQLGKELGMNMAIYERGEGYIKSLDFTDAAKVNFEAASTFMGDNEEYSDVVKSLEKLCPDAIPDYVKMIFLDTICANPDRHTNNFGLLRDVQTGELLGLAPNYDNNMALISRGYPSKTGNKDVLITMFKELLEEYPSFRSFVPQVTEETVRKVLNKLNMKVKSQLVVDLVTKRYEMITK